jgi:hypothetical protein
VPCPIDITETRGIAAPRFFLFFQKLKSPLWLGNIWNCVAVIF